MVGMMGSHLLSPTLITTLHFSGFHVIWDIVDAEKSTPFYTHWKDAAAICLSAHLILEWTDYINNLKLSRIILSNFEDCLIWDGGSKLDTVIVKEAYCLITRPPCLNMLHPLLART